MRPVLSTAVQLVVRRLIMDARVKPEHDAESVGLRLFTP